jgi:glycosyltransferase involved in cell wall biosynthesis
LIEDGRDGIVLPEAEPEILAARLDELARDGARLAELGRAARVRVEALGGWNAYGDRMEALVRELVRGDGQ